MTRPSRLAAARLETAWGAIEGSASSIDVELVGGALLRLHGDSVLGGYICREGFEADEILFVERYLRRGDVFADVGANIGLFTVVAARRVGRQGRVFAFEPGRIARERLEANLMLNRCSNATVFDFALSDCREQGTLSVPENGHDAFGSLASPIVDFAVVRETVETRTWDEAAANLLREPRVTMMKLDVEGWETRVLRGAASQLRGPEAPLLQVEFAEATARSAGTDCSELFDQLVDLGYTVCRLDPARMRLVRETKRSEYLYTNLYATKRMEQDNRRLRRGLHWRVRSSLVGNRVVALVNSGGE